MSLWDRFGYTFKKKDVKDEENAPKSFSPPESNDALVVAEGGFNNLVQEYGLGNDVFKDEASLINKYREMSLQPEIDSAIDDIVNEAVVYNEREQPVRLWLEDAKLSPKIIKMINNEFEEILSVLRFKDNSYDMFRKFYIDGRLYYHKIIDPKNPKEGIKEIRYIDPRKIRKVKNVQVRRDEKTGTDIYVDKEEFFIYNPTGIATSDAASEAALKIHKDSICYVTSGISDSRNKMVLGYLHKAIRPLNQLRIQEDSVVIYKLVRAPERRVFYIDVGNTPKQKAEQYVRDMMAKFKNKITYDSTTGDLKDERRFMSMLEDFWLPRREGGKSTEIQTIGGNMAGFTDMTDVNYFLEKLYKSLNVPFSRFATDNAFNMGRSSEITRDEIKFSKFVSRIRSKFTVLFDDLLRTQLALKKIMTTEEWDNIKSNIFYDFIQDNHFAELKNMELLQNRINIAQDMDPFVGKYFSREYVRRNVLNQSDEDLAKIDEQMDKEIEKFGDPMAVDDQGNPIPASGGGDLGIKSDNDKEDDNVEAPPAKKTEDDVTTESAEDPISAELVKSQLALTEAMTKFYNGMADEESDA